ncbi:hypothetical protein [Marinobacter fuscus]|nr:hypothetical protein [Marinobacter fuscus]
MTDEEWLTLADESDDFAGDDEQLFDDAMATEQVYFVDDFGSDGDSLPEAEGTTDAEPEAVTPASGSVESRPLGSEILLETNEVEQEKLTVSEFDDLMAKAVASIPECLAGGVVDMDSGMLVGVKTVDSHPQEVLDMLSAATHDLFQGPNVVTIENMFKKARGLDLDDFHYFKEIIVNSENLIHVFIRGKQNPQYVTTFVCRLSANLGMVLTKARAQMPILEAAI